MNSEYPFVSLESGDLRLTVSVPDEKTGFYRGARFDRAGVFSRIEYGGVVFSGQWYDLHDPYRHDCLTGPVEEFSQNGYDDTAPGGLFVKPGVGILRREDEKPYDWFHRYPLADEGERFVEVSGNDMSFRQSVNGEEYGYEYVKKIVLCDSPGSFRIEHCLSNIGSRPLEGMVYNHNFFTLGGRGTGPWSGIDFPFSPAGDWRSEYDSVALTDSGIRFLRPLMTGETVYMGNVHSPSGYSPYGFKISSVLEDGRVPSVEVSSDAVMHHAVFWGIRRIACVEPHTPYDIHPGKSFKWSVSYKLTVK